VKTVVFKTASKLPLPRSSSSSWTTIALPTTDKGPPKGICKKRKWRQITTWRNVRQIGCSRRDQPEKWLLQAITWLQMINKYIDTTKSGLRIPVYNHSSSLTAKTIWSLLWYTSSRSSQKINPTEASKEQLIIHLGVSDGCLCNTWKRIEQTKCGFNNAKRM
jgi:hypothetical protein